MMLSPVTVSNPDPAPNPPGAYQVFQVTGRANSGEEWVNQNGRMYLTSSDLELCFDLESELFQVVLDKQVRVLDAKQVHNANYESLYEVIDKDTKVMSMHLHEKLSGNQHAESLRRPHLECWDLHVGAKVRRRAPWREGDEACARLQPRKRAR